MSSSSLPGGKPLLRVLAGERLPKPPIWIMRQAGRYLPEYRELRATTASFMEFCYSPVKAAEATLQPIRRFGFDAAILFSDILVVPDALGQEVTFAEGEGPRLHPITLDGGLSRLADEIDLERLSPVFEAIERVRAGLGPETTFLGFCGAPWTVASYMIAGKGTPELAPSRLLAYRDPDFLVALIDRLVEASIRYLVRQFQAGVDAVQIFESFAGALTASGFERWSLQPIRRIVDGVRAQVPHARIIVFTRAAGAGHRLTAERTGADAVALDWAVNGAWAAENVQALKPVQGNLDPLTVVAGGQALEEGVRDVLAAFSSGPHIFNLGHGIVPETPVENVGKLVKLVRGETA
ncbi:uroporphyrinogen decarboxylase [Alsobacter soli]|uniref:uroporphyrinogen decarboxylase n=1 Tax=Alsobacter soli TaxID=2109933 RepID=UPI002477F12C|nr:uroporphyrinogen decarboxylase [Alsobacter soli]